MVEHATRRTLYVSPGTTLHRVLDDMRTMSSEAVEIALDPLAVVFSTPDHFRALDAVRAAQSLRVTFVVADAHRTGLALAFGYQVRAPETGGPTSALGARGSPGVRQPVAGGTPSRTLSTQGPLATAPLPGSRQFDETRDTAHSSSRSRRPRRAGRLLWRVSAAVMTLLMLAGGAGAIVMWNLHAAEVVLNPAEQPFSRVVPFAVSVVPTDDPNTIQTTPFETNLTRTADATATGQTTVPDGIASGSFTFRSRADGATTIKAGTALRGPKDIIYILQGDVAVPGLDFVRGQLGEARGPVKASLPGPAGNLGAGYSARYTDNLTYISGEITGGTEKQVPVVTEDDIAAVRARLEGDIRKSALSEVNAALTPGTTALNDNLTLRSATVDARPPAGTHADTVHVQVTITAHIPVYRNADFDAFIDRKLSEAVREAGDQAGGQAQVVPESVMKSRPVFVDVQGALVHYFATVNGILRAVITDADVSRIRQSLIGQDAAGVARVLTAEKGIEARDVRYGPRWLPSILRDRMPLNSSHIHVQLARPGE